MPENSTDEKLDRIVDLLGKILARLGGENDAIDELLGGIWSRLGDIETSVSWIESMLRASRPPPADDAS